MVEFGLKLEDNKVADWADKYIDYEKLKSLIKRAKNAVKNRDALQKRNPSLAAEIIAAYVEGRRSQPGTPTSLSQVSLPSYAAEEERREKEKEQAQPPSKGGEVAHVAGEAPEPPPPSQTGGNATSSTRGGVPSFEISSGDDDNGDKSTTPLLPPNTDQSKAKYGSSDSVPSVTPNVFVEVKDLSRQGSSAFGSKPSLSRQNSEKSVGRLLSGVGGYFQRSSYEKKLKAALREVDAHVLDFADCLYKELDKVNAFYGEEIDILTKRLEVLVESVNAVHPNGPDDLIGDSEMIYSYRQRRGSIKEMVRRKFESVVNPNKNGIAHGLETVEESDDEAVALTASQGSERAKNDHVIRESDSVKRALIDLHRTAKLLNNFSIMNYTGFIKILKKFDKTFPEHKGKYSSVIKDKICHEGKEAEQLADRMEQLYAKWFCDWNIREARAQMLPKRGDGLQMDWSQLRLGYRLGMCAILALWVCWDCIWGLVSDGNTTIGGRTAFPVFRACGGLLLVHWFWGFSVYIWTRYRINYIFLFDFNPRVVDMPIDILNDAVDETLVFLLCMLLYYKSGAHDMPQWIPPGGYPFFLVLYTAKRLIFPWRTRGPFWKGIRDVVTAPLTSPTFYTVFVADWFTSLVKVFQDILWTACFVVTGDWLSSENLEERTPHLWQNAFWYKNVVVPLICLFPLWIRFNQCLRRYLDTGKRWPNLANAFKYAMSQTVTLFGAFHPLYLMHVYGKPAITHHHLHNGDDTEAVEMHTVGGTNLFQIFWMGLFICSSLYSFFWDVNMDWGLGRPEYSMLGPRLMYPKRLHYYGVMCADLFLRFMWVLTLIPPQSGAKFEIPNYLSAVTMSLELLRRTLWGFFRLEHEHRHNTEGYRRVDFVPLHFNTGHAHKYENRQRERVGWSVLAEVAVVSAAVIIVSVASVVAAQRAAHYVQGLGEL